MEENRKTLANEVLSLVGLQIRLVIIKRQKAEVSSRPHVVCDDACLHGSG